MKKIMLIASIGILFLVLTAMLSGCIVNDYGLLDILGPEGYETQKKWYNNYQGNTYSELLLPADRKGFITSYRNDLNFGLSETIVVAGNYKAQLGWSQIEKLKYIVYYKANPWSAWEPVSEPGGHTENWISVANPEIFDPVSGTSDRRDCQPYVFNIRGVREGAIRVELWGYFDPNEINPFDSWEWVLLSSDQALLESGKCGMWLPDKGDGTYQSTFEIGETVNIKVETGVGAPDIVVDARAGEKTWELHLLKPDGSQYTDQGFPMKLADHFQGTISFIVYENMFTLKGNNRYELQLYNTLWKKGALEISAIDFKAKMPSKPIISPDCGLSIKVPGTISVTISGTPNAATQLPIQSFGVMVWYGKHTDLAPGDWGEERWIMHQTVIDASKHGDTYTGSFSFAVTYPDRYVTIIAYVHDTDGRDSDTEYYQIKTYSEDKPDEEDLVNDGGGQGLYGGGTSGETTPWDFWETPVIDYTLLIIALAIFFACLIIALLVPFPVFGRLAVIVLGVVLAVLIYFYL